MKTRRSSSKPLSLLAAAWVTTVSATASYLAVVERFELTPLLVSVLVVAASAAIFAYWLPGEPRLKQDDRESF